MKPIRTAALALSFAIALSIPSLTHPAHAGTVGFEEDFALSPDRSSTLSQLIPGTEDFYYYTALNFQNQNELDKTDTTLAAWIKQFGRTPRAQEMENRQALLRYAKDHAKTIDYLTRTLGLQFNHQKETAREQAALPTALDPKLISRETLTQRALATNPQTLAGFENSAIDWLTAHPPEKLSDERLHELLSRLTRPDYENLVPLIAHDLSTKYDTGFGSLQIHRQLLLDQLNALLKTKPELLNDTNFVMTYLTKLRPAIGTDLAHDTAERQSYLDRMWDFASKLGPQHNSLKANILYQRLVFDRKQGIWDKDRFLAYLQLPRPVWYINPRYMEQQNRRDYPVNLNADYSASTNLAPIRDDEPLVRSYLLRLLADAPDPDAYKPYLESTYLKEVFAEAHILAGIGDQDTFAAMLPASKLQAIRDRVELEFAYTNKEIYAPDDKVSLGVSVKNVKTLIVKVYEVNAANYYKKFKREVSTDINLDGLVANEERTIEYKGGDDSPLRRIDRVFPFEKLTGRGTWVIEFIGNGKSSRALVRKGKLRQIERESSAGHIFTVFDESNKKVPDARLWMTGHEYTADNDGDIQVPFSTNPTTQPIVLMQGDFASLDSFQHNAETYRLEAGIHVPRESLLKYGAATVSIRPALHVNSVLVSPKLLEEVTLLITSTDLDGTAATKEVPNFKLFEDQNSTYEFNVPDRLKAVSFTLRAKIQNISQNKKDDLSVTKTFTINEIDATDKIEDTHLSKIDGEYVIDVLGKTGEQMPDRPLQIALKHKDFKEQIHVTLKSDAAGRVKLGALEGIDNFTVTSPEGVTRTYHPEKDARVEVAAVHGSVGDTLSIPYMGKANAPDHATFSLLELRDAGTFVADRFDALTLKDGYLRIKGLPAGDFDLVIKDDPVHYAIRIASGDETSGWVLGPTRFLQLKNRDPLQITSVKSDDANVTVQLAHANKFARVHVFSTRFVPAFSPFADLAVSPPQVLYKGIAPAETLYESGRSIGDEYRYIIDRKYAPKYPGNMLARPGLLLNPWAIRGTDTGQQEAKAGQDYHGVSNSAAPATPPADTAWGLAHASENQRLAAGMSENLDFLAEFAQFSLNLTPNDQGIVEIPRKLLGSHQQIHIVATDLQNTVYREISLPQPEQKTRDLRMSITLDPTKHFTEQKQVTVLEKGQTVTLSDASGSNLESYDTLTKAYRLYSALKPDATLAEFAFILNWPSMKDAEKREKYSKYACHELNFFLYKKDPEFFKTVVLPYLKDNKKDKTFLDHFLIGDDLSSYTDPWAFDRLNTVERVLLGQRIAAEKAGIARHLKERLDLLPPDIERYNFLFRTALSANSLSKTGPGSLSTNMPTATISGGYRFDGDGTVVGGEVAGMARMKDLAAAQNGQQAMDRARERPQKAAEAMRSLQKKSKFSDDSKLANKLQAAEKLDELSKNLEEANGDFAAKDEQKRAEARLLYRKPDKTMEYVENNYYHLPIEVQLADLVKVNAFWRDLADQKAGAAFLSKNMAEPVSNFTEIMFALSVLDLPFDEPTHTTKREGGTFTLTAGGPIIAYHKEIKEAQPAGGGAEKTPVLVSQNYFRYDDRYTFVDNEQTDKYVTEEFLTHVVYGCQVVITNPTSSRQKLDALLQIPKGAMPVLNAQYSRGLHMDLAPYETKSIEYAFYFPGTGEFPHYPVQVAKNEKLVASVPPDTLKVVATPSKVDATSWEYISQNGTPEQVIDYLKANNIERVNLEKIAWRMKDKNFFSQVIALLRDRHVYANTLWSYAIKHDDTANIEEFLEHQDNFVQQCGEYLDSPVLKINPAARYSYQHMEYMPLVNARAHKLGQDRQVLNNRFFQQYERTLEVLRYHPALTDEDMLAATYYLLLQDRVDDGLKMFKRIDPKKLQEKIQYDYFTAYTDFYQEDPAGARAVAMQYQNYPVDRWKSLFAGVLAQADEIDGKKAAVVDKEDRNQQQNALATTEPTFEFKVEAKNIVLAYKNIPDVKVNYYLMDIELMFSQNPFLQEYGGQFSMIKPNETAVVKLDPTKGTLSVPLPDKFLTRNVMVEIVGAGQTKSQAYYANSLNIQLAENYGQLTVLSDKTGKSLPKAYVKVYAKMNNGHVRFYKDGYTDLRGKFDYTSLNTDELDQVASFSLLILSDTDGGIVRTAAPPKR